MSKKQKKPTKALLDELQPIFEKHGWSAFAIGAPSETKESACPDGQVPTDVTIQLPDGSTITRTVCL
jgi:hypothetical protein